MQASSFLRVKMKEEVLRLRKKKKKKKDMRNNPESGKMKRPRTYVMTG